MSRQWIPYGLLLVVSVIAGIVIGGGPGALSSAGSPAESPTIEILTTDPSTSSSTVAPESVPAETTVSNAPITASSTPTEPNGTTATPTTTAATTTTAAPATTTTTVPTTTTTLFVELRSRDDLNVAVANGVGTVGAAGVAADALAGLGYQAPATRDAALFEITTVFYRDGLDAEAGRLAIDAGLDPESIASISELPDLIGSDSASFELILVLGTDGAGPRSGST